MFYRLTKPVINGRKSETWYITFNDKGRTRRVSTRVTDKDQAKAVLERYKALRDAPHHDFTLSLIFDRYQAARLSEGVNPVNIRTSLLPIREHFNHKSHTLIGQSAIRDYIAARSKKVGKGAIARELATLRASLNWAKREKLIEGFTPFKIPSGRNPRKRYLTREEFALLESAATTLRMRLFLSIAINTASRSKGIYRLKWEHIDPAAMVINFPEGVGNKRTRSVPINTSLSWALGVGYCMRLGDYVIERSGEPVTSLTKQFQDTVKRAGLVNVTIHDLRRTAASWALQGGASMETVAALLNDSVEVVERHYGHFATGHIRGVTDILG